MFTRQLIAAAAMMAATCAANADVVTNTSTVTSDMSIVDTSTALSGADAGLAAVMASTNANSPLVLVRGVEGLYMLAARANAPLQTSADQASSPADGATDALPVINADAAVVNAAAVPEPATLTLMLAGVLGAIGFTRSRKQG